MMKIIKYLLLILLLGMGTFGCKERFFANYDMPQTGYLVVAGYISNGLSPTEIRLSRTTTLSDNPREVMERGASVFIESNHSDKYLLAEVSEGIYRSGSILLDSSKQYRIIINAKGKQYQSDYSPVQQTPDIDSVSWKRTDGGVQLFANAHDDTNRSKYYQWKYEETWEINTPFVSNIEYVYEGALITGVKFRYPDRRPLADISQCWTTLTSSKLLLGSTEKLSKDIIQAPVQYIPPGSERLSVMYSILIKQYKISEQAYNYFSLMKKNTEQLGTVFDPQPSMVRGNIICVNDPEEPVVGFVEVAQEKQQRLFLRNSDVPGWFVPGNCITSEFPNNPDSLRARQPTGMPTISYVMDPPGNNIITFLTAPASCIDCRRSDNTNQKPGFWP